MTDGPPGDRLEVRRSSRRKKTISVHREGDVIIVNAPMWMSAADVERHARELVARLRKRETAPASDVDLLTRALWLRLEFLPEAPEPNAVRWATQESRWGSCSTLDASIRISSQLRRAPQYVVDAVIVHELAHLLRANHGPEFKHLIARYPDNARADAFLAGVAFAKGIPNEY
jgi:hypothetical protein